MEIIVPCAGLSTRFPNMRPKYLLTDYSGKLMLEKSIGNLIDNYPVTVILLKEHVDKFDSYNIICDAFNDRLNIIVLDERTNGPAETVYEGLKKAKIEGDFLVKDCDSFFDFDIDKDQNVVYTSKLQNNPNLTDVSKLGYVLSNDQGIVTGLVEKKIVSDSFCVGGYQFKSTKRFFEVYENLQSKIKNELFISNMIDYMISNQDVFIEKNVRNYINAGDSKSWFEYNNKPTIFCDIDGVLVENQPPYGINGYLNKNYKPIKNNVDVLLTKLKEGYQIVFTTARNQNKYYNVTRKMLDNLGFVDCQLIMDLHHSKRILINDFTDTNPYPTSISVNLKRNSENLEDYL